MAFDDGDSGYGLVVRLPQDQPSLLAAVVRRADVGVTPERDLAAQEGFCGDELDPMVRRLEGAIGLSVSPFVRIEPGQRRVGTVTPEAWPARMPRAPRRPGTGSVGSRPATRAFILVRYTSPLDQRRESAGHCSTTANMRSCNASGKPPSQWPPKARAGRPL